MLRLVLAYTLALLATQALPMLPPWWVGAVVLVVALVLAMRKPLTMAWRAIGIAAALGFVLTLWRAELRLADRWPESRQGEELVVTGHVGSLPERATAQWHARGDEADAESQTWRFTFEPDQPGVPQRIRTSWYRAPETLRGGECWRFTLKLKSPRGSQNPDGFDYEGWLFRQGIGANAVVRAAVRCEGGAAAYPVLRLRQGIRDRLEATLAETPARAVLIALVLGDSSGLRDADWQAFRLTGTSHFFTFR